MNTYVHVLVCGMCDVYICARGLNVCSIYAYLCEAYMYFCVNVSFVNVYGKCVFVCHVYLWKYVLMSFCVNVDGICVGECAW